MSTPEKTNLNRWIGHGITILIAGLGLAFSYGAMDARMNDLESRVTSLDNNLMPLMHSLREDINDVKVKMAEIGADVRWLKDGKESPKK